MDTWMIALLNHFRLTWRLLRDRRVSLWPKLLLVGLPALYALLPLPDDMLPVVGILDDVFVLGLCTLAFNHLPPWSLVQEHRQALSGGPCCEGYPELDSMRCPDETRHLALGFALSCGLLALSGWAAGIVGLATFIMGYFSTKLARGQMVGNAVQVTPHQLPEIYRVFQAAQAHLPPVRVQLFVSHNPVMNAYTFGYRQPYTIVLSSNLVEKLELAEIQAVIGHELGHIVYGHTHLTGLMGGAAAFLKVVFYQWSRSCEYSADAAALIACNGRVEPVVSTMLKLGSGLVNLQLDLQAFLEQGEAEDRSSANTAETLSTHPFIQKRIRRLIELAGHKPTQAQPGLVQAFLAQPELA